MRVWACMCERETSDRNVSPALRQSEEWSSLILSVHRLKASVPPQSPRVAPVLFSVGLLCCALEVKGVL